MATTLYLAMTAAEIASNSHLPPRIAWLACHFSPYSTGLSNLPQALPADSLLILSDRIPIHRHDPARIAAQLDSAVCALGCRGILLDFQRPDCAETSNLVKFLSDGLPCPVGVSDCYASECTGPVFLSPCPHHMPLAEHIAPWAGREIWLDLAVDAQAITLTREGSRIYPLPLGEIPDRGHTDPELHCHYSVENTHTSSQFRLWRTQDDLASMVKTADTLGIRTLIGLYQELNPHQQNTPSGNAGRGEDPVTDTVPGHGSGG